MIAEAIGYITLYIIGGIDFNFRGGKD